MTLSTGRPALGRWQKPNREKREKAGMAVIDDLLRHGLYVIFYGSSLQAGMT